MDKLFYRLTLLLLLITTNSFAKVLTDKQIVEKHIPPEFLKAMDISVDPPVPIKKTDRRIKFVKSNFGSKDGSSFLFVTYLLAYSDYDRELREIRVIKINKDGSSIVLPSPPNYQKIGIDPIHELNLVDLDGDGIDEVLLENFGERGPPEGAYILKWNGNILENITPSDSEGYTILSGFNYLVVPGLRPILYYKEYTKLNSKSDLITTFHATELTPTGFVDLGAFDFVDTFYKEGNKFEEKEITEVKLKPGVYTLEVKSSSKHKKAVRAEVSVNGIIVLKPEDFCARNNEIKKEDKKDEDDQNEDHHKNCVPKNEVYADVTLVKTNEIKVKLYGKKNSRIQVSLKKKN